MNIAKWTARVANWKRQDAVQKPLEYHLAHLHEEVSETFTMQRMIAHGKPGWQAPPGITRTNPYEHYWPGEDGKPEGFGIELADVVLVALYIAAVTGVDLEKMMEVKMAYNEGKRAKSA